jgi:hypothetical protein
MVAVAQLLFQFNFHRFGGNNTSITAVIRRLGIEFLIFDAD